jgi:hypothetical protein
MPSTANDTKVIAEYVQACHQLARDIEGILEDIEYRINGGEIRYAIDFSELHAYADPVPQKLEQLKIFADDDLASCWAIQNAVVNLLLFGLDHKPILLPPYIVELEGYLNWSENQRSKALAGTLARASREAAKLNSSKEFEKLIDIVDALQHNPNSVSTEERAKLFRFVDSNASNLVIMVQSGQTRPDYILREVLRRRPFDDLWTCATATGCLEPDSLRLNEETARRWERELSARRSGRAGATYRDAYVMMLLEAVDRVFAKTNTKLCLVTRSTQMHEIFEQDLKEKRWEGPQGRLLRHPRSFVASGARSADDLRTVRQRLKDQHTSIQAFLDMTASLAGIAPDEIDPSWAPLYEWVREREDTERAGELIEAIKRDWRQLVSLAAAEAGAQGVVREADLGERSRLDVVSEVFRAVNDPGALRTHMRQRIRELVQSINFKYQYATALEGRALSREDVEDDVRAAVGADSMTIDATYVPYTMAFHSPQVVAWSRHLSQGQYITPEEVLQLFEQGFMSGHTYEPLLALAYFFAAWDRWTVAHDYADLAITARVDDDPSPVEGYLFKATCLRLMSEPASDDAMKLLEDAIAMTKRKDARVLVEKGAQILRASMHSASARANVQEAIDLGGEVMDMLRDRTDDESTMLKIRVYNNLCYHYLHFDDDESRKRARANFDRFLELAADREPDRSRWRPPFLDTLYWAEWQLEAKRLTGEEHDRRRKRLIRQYEDLLSRNLRQSTRAVASGHLRMIQGVEVPAA